MAYIIDDQKNIEIELGKMSIWKKKFKVFFAKVHYGNISGLVTTNIEHIDAIANMQRKLYADPRMSIGFIVLDRGLEIWFYFDEKIFSVGIINTDIVGWNLVKYGSLTFLFIDTYTNRNDNLKPIMFYVKDQNIPLVREYFTKHGYKEQKK